MEHKNIVIDFDGTLMPYSFPIAKEPYPETIIALNKLKELGFRIIISSARTSSMIKSDNYYNSIEYIKDYLNKYNIPYDEIFIDKPIAKYYIDDRAIRIKNGNWKAVLDFINTEEKYELDK